MSGVAKLNTNSERQGSPKLFHYKPLFWMFFLKTASSCLANIILLMSSCFWELSPLKSLMLTWRIKWRIVIYKEKIFSEVIFFKNMKYFVKFKTIYIFLSEVQPEIEGWMVFDIAWLLPFVLPNIIIFSLPSIFKRNYADSIDNVMKS